MQLLHVGSNVLKLGWDGGVLVGVGLTLARPSKAFPTSKPEKKKFMRIKYEEKSPLSLAVESAGGLRSTEGELGGTEVATALAVLLPTLLVHARAVLLPDGVAGGRAEGGAQVAAGREESSQVGNADRLLAALAFPCRLEIAGEDLVCFAQERCGIGLSENYLQ